MKRVEVIEHIKSELQELAESLENTTEKRRRHIIQNKAESILDMLEGFGMMPPNKDNAVDVELGKDGSLFVSLWGWDE
jgi:5,10-methylenetetrahydrofolate reductase